MIGVEWRRQLVLLEDRFADSQQELQATRRRLDLLLHESGAALFEWDIEADRFHFSRALLDLLDYSADAMELLFRRREFIHRDDRAAVAHALRRHLVARKPIDIECRLRLSDCRYRWFRLVGNSEWIDGARWPCYFTGSMTDVDDRRRGEALLERMASVDSLTDIPNRLRFGESLEQAICEADTNGSHFALLVINLNDFKSINDSCGNAVGDSVLKQVAEILQSSVKGFDVAARLGGDEFGIILKQIERNEHVAAVCRKILASLGQQAHGPLRENRVSACIGISLYPGNGVTAHDLMVHAGSALLAARRQRGHEGSFAFYDPAADREPRFRRRLEQHLEEALAREEFSIDYQPEATLGDRHIVAAEALLRWDHPERGRIGPAEFIAAAESSGLIVGIGEWLVDRVGRDLQRWLEIHPAARVAINLSPVQVANGDVVDCIRHAMDRYRLAPGSLEVEVTENVLLHDLDRARDVLNALHDLGVMVSLDDFGSGYSSLAYLQQLPIDKVKIDRMFISRMETDSNSRIITATIIRLAHSLKMQVLAEGVETIRQAEILQELGCDYMQGFLLAYPRPFEEFIASLCDGGLRPLRLRPMLREA